MPLYTSTFIFAKEKGVGYVFIGLCLLSRIKNCATTAQLIFTKFGEKSSTWDTEENVRFWYPDHVTLG